MNPSTLRHRIKTRLTAEQEKVFLNFIHSNCFCFVNLVSNKVSEPVQDKFYFDIIKILSLLHLDYIITFDEKFGPLMGKAVFLSYEARNYVAIYLKVYKK